MESVQTVSRKRNALLIMISAAIVLVWYLVDMYSLNVGGINGILSFYTGIATAFTASAFSSTPMIILSIAVYLAIVVFLVLFILACAKKNAPKGFKSRAIIYALITLVVSIILLG